MKLRRIGVTLVLVLCALGIGYAFWHQELKYAKPTPIPMGYKEVLPGDIVSLPTGFQKETAYFIHFYNADCPCTRFNARYIHALTKEFKGNIDFVIVATDQKSKQKAEDEFGSDLTYRVDADGRIAQACGVYSTPQAAIIHQNGSLYYRGNYNRSRYCTDRATNFAELSLIALLNNQPAPQLGILATQSYGCELPNTRVALDFF
jgi:hypothetical protein